MRLQSCENSRLYLGMAPDGRVQPVRESDDVDVRRFYPEVIECESRLPFALQFVF